MDFKTIIIWVIILGVTIVPFILIAVRKNLKEKKILMELKNFAEQNNSELSVHEQKENILIGLDKSSKKLFFIKRNKENGPEKAIDLSEFKSCKVINTTRTVGEGATRQSVIDKIDIVLYYCDKNKSFEQLEFYNNKYDRLVLSGEVQLAEKWSEIINSAINER